jgi:hypothetical protein
VSDTEVARLVGDLRIVREQLQAAEEHCRLRDQQISGVRSQLIANGYLRSSDAPIGDALDAAIADGTVARARRAGLPVPEDDLGETGGHLRALALAQRRRVGFSSTVLDPLPSTRNSDSALILGALDAARDVLASLRVAVTLAEPADRAHRLLSEARDRLRDRIRERIPDDVPETETPA